MVYLIKCIKKYFNMNQNYEIISNKLIYKSLPCIGNCFIKKANRAVGKNKAKHYFIKKQSFLIPPTLQKLK